MRRVVVGSLLAATAGWACSEGPAAPAQVPGALGAAIRCEALPGQGALTCVVPPGAGGAGAREPAAGTLVTLGEQGELVRLEATGAAYDSAATVFQANFTVQNLLGLLLGSPDGFALAGLTVFHHSGPVATVGSGAVAVLDPDGSGAFTEAAQPYFHYAQVLDPGEVSAPRTWRWSVPPTVETFAFEVFVRSHVGAAVVPPATAFEERDGAGWTTHEEEVRFLGAVAEASPRMSYAAIGTSVEGRPLHLVRVGYPAPPVDAAVAAGRSVLVIGGQHGNEPAGREMALELLRDLAFTRDATLVEQLAGTTVLLIPTANPDGRAADTRGNAQGRDTNRDHLRLATPEGRVMARVLCDFTPDVVIDAHERPGASVQDMQLLWPRNLNAHAPVRELSREMVLEHVWPELAAAGYSVGLYGPGPGPPGDENETILRNAAGLRHSLAVLTESAGQQPALHRVRVQLAAVHGVLRFHRERIQDVALAVTEAPAHKAAAGAARSEPFFLFGADNAPPSPEEVLDPPPCGYLVDAAGEAALARQIELFPLRVERVGEEGLFVGMDQPLMTVVPLLLDDRARARLVTAVPLHEGALCSAPGAGAGAGPAEGRAPR